MNAPVRAEKAATELLQRVGVSDLPVPVEQIATSLSADVTYEAYEGDISGMLYRTDTGAIIGVNSTHPPVRQRFTLAHEVGHLVLHRGQPMFIDRFVRVNWRDGSSNKEEMAANAFAAELLMPREFVAREVGRVVTKRPTVTPKQLADELAKAFHVSTQAMSYRLENLGVVDPQALTG